MKRFLSLALLPLLVVCSLGACSSKTGTTGSSDTPVLETPAGDVPTAAANDVIALDLSFTDPQLADTVTIAGFMPSFGISPALRDKFSAGLNGGVVSLVEVQAQTGGEYYSSIVAGRFRLICNDQRSVPQTSPFADEMTTAGFPPFPDSGISAGESGDYWIAFLVSGDPNPTDCTLSYTRDAAVESGTGDEIPEFTTTVQLN